ncbi:MAG: hypothetical protein AAGI22_19720 [Planctomycetota bacterium]
MDARSRTLYAFLCAAAVVSTWIVASVDRSSSAATVERRGATQDGDRATDADLADPSPLAAARDAPTSGGTTTQPAEYPVEAPVDDLGDPLLAVNDSAVEGVVVLGDGTPLAGVTVRASKWDERDASGGSSDDAMRRRPNLRPESKTGAQGTFRLEPLLADWVVTDVVEVDGVEGDHSGPFPVPSGHVEIRLAAVAVDVVLPPTVKVPEGEARAIGPDSWIISGTVAKAVPVVDGERQDGFAFSLGGFDEQGVARFVLPQGPGYAFTLERPRRGALSGELEEGLPSGHYRVDLAEDGARRGLLRVTMTGVARSADESIHVSLDPLRDDGTRIQRSFDLGLQIPGWQRSAERTGLVAGRYRLSATLGHAGTNSMLRCALSAREIEVVDGSTAELEIRVERGARLEIVPRGEAAGRLARLRFEYYDVDLQSWVPSRLLELREGERPRFASSVRPGKKYRVRDALPVGTCQLRLTGNGWTSVESTVALAAGEV